MPRGFRDLRLSPTVKTGQLERANSVFERRRKVFTLKGSSAYGLSCPVTGQMNMIPLRAFWDIC